MSYRSLVFAARKSGMTSCSWKPSAEPAVYDCRAAKLRLPLWSQVCSKAAAKYQGYQPNLQSLGLRACNGTHAHAHRMLRQLNGRTVAVMGDSHALNLWCALTCWFSSAPGVLVERRDQPASLTIGRLANFSYGMTHVEEGAVRSRVAWMLPACYKSSGNRCGDPTSMTARFCVDVDSHRVPYKYRLPSTGCHSPRVADARGSPEHARRWPRPLESPAGRGLSHLVLHAVPPTRRVQRFSCRDAGCSHG